MTGLTDSLQRVLKALNRSELPELPYEVRVVVNRYQAGVPYKPLWDEEPGTLVAEALRAVWNDKVRSVLRQDRAAPKDWLHALVPVAQYLVPVLDNHVTWSTDNAQQQLRRLEWVKEWVGDLQLAKNIIQSSAGIVKERTYQRWRRQGLQYLVEAIRCIVADFEIGLVGTSLIRFPEELLVPREVAVKELREHVLDVSDGEKWVALVGMRGVGKTTLLGLLTRDAEVKTAYGPNIIVISLMPVKDVITEKEVLWRLAIHLGLRWVSRKSNVEMLRDLIRSQLVGRHVLLIVDDVKSPTSLWALRGLGNLTVLVALHTLKAARELNITADQVVMLEGLTLGESTVLAIKACGSKPETEVESVAMGKVLNVVERYPLAIYVAAHRAAEIGWRRLLELYQNPISLTVELGSEHPDSKMWTPLVEAWQSLPFKAQEHLALLGLMPFFQIYDVGVGMAAWRAADLENAESWWNELVDTGLVHQARKNCYQIHALVWKLAESKAKSLPASKQKMARCWEWRYPLKQVWPGWRQFWPSVPVPPEDTGLSLWKPGFPGTEEDRRVMWAADILERVYWRSDARLGLSASIIEWVIMWRNSTILKILLPILIWLTFWPMVTDLWKALFNIEIFCPGGWARNALAGLVGYLWIVLYTDEQRIAGWCIMGRSFTEALED